MLWSVTISEYKLAGPILKKRGTYISIPEDTKFCAELAKCGGNR